MENAPTNKRPAPAGKRPKPETTKVAPKKKGKGLLIVLIILALGGITWGIIGFLDGSNKANVIVELKAENEELKESSRLELEAKTASIELMISELQTVKDERDQLDLDNDELNSQIEFAKAELQKYKNKNYVNAAKVKELNNLITELTAEVSAKQEELETQKKLLEEEKEKNAELAANNEELQNQNKDLQTKLELGSILTTEHIEVCFVRNDKEVYKKDNEFKSKVMDHIRISARLDDNKTAERDEKEFLLKIIEPTGTVLIDDSHGKSFTRANGKTDFCTTTQTLKFTNSRQKVIFNYKKGDEYKPGAYKIEIFCESHKIGSAGFLVK